MGPRRLHFISCDAIDSSSRDRSRIREFPKHESLNHLIDARDQRMITEDELLIEEHHIRKAINAVTGLIRHLETTKGPPEPRTQNPTEPDPEPGTGNP